jgi:protease-4
MPIEKVNEIADGRVFVAEEALGLGLIDQIGYFPDALDAMAELIGNDSLHVIRYERKATLMDVLENEGIFGINSGLRFIENASRTRLMYKWK